jgi:ABC-type sugar transport system substrate-binding protein
MKRNLAVALSFLALLVGGCSTTAAPTSSASSSPGVSATGRHIAFFVPWTEDVWYVVAIDGAKAAAANLGVQLDVFDASNKLEQQIQQFDAAIAAKPEAIVVSSVDAAGMVPSVEKAHDAGIKVIAYDRPIYATTKLDGLVILDTKNMGEMSAKAAVDALTAKYGSPKGKIIRGYGDLADTWVTGISSGFDPYMAKYPDIKVLQASSGQWDPAQSAANVQQLLTSNPDVDGIVLDSDFLATGILTALKSGGYGKVGEAKHIYFLGNGGMTEALQAIRDGWMDATVYNPVPDFTAAAVKFADMLATGQQLPTEWVDQGKPWSPAAVGKAVPAAGAPYAGPVLNMRNFLVDKTNAVDPTLWGNVAAKTK